MSPNLKSIRKAPCFNTIMLNLQILLVVNVAIVFARVQHRSSVFVHHLDPPGWSSKDILDGYTLICPMA